MKHYLLYFLTFSVLQSWGQNQTCPININFSESNLNHWFGYTGQFQRNSSRDKGPQIFYDSIGIFPTGTQGTSIIPEYGLSNYGIEVQTANFKDPFGDFETIPTINGYYYGYSVRVGSSTINANQTRNTSNGGLFRGLGYTINVPAGATTVPYVVTYAYAMVLESASHVSDQVPMFTATLTTSSGTIDCANALYFLPTNGQGNNFALDVTAAKQKGFALSSVPSPNVNGNNNDPQLRVWTKGWTEVIFDLAKYRGQQVTLSFEADNCVPSGHFAYAYVALKNICEGLQIAGPIQACVNGDQTYSIPELTGGTYSWTIPTGWKMVTDSGNIIIVKPNANPGTITARASNNCADLTTSVNVVVSPPTIAGAVVGDSAVCFGLVPNQQFPLQLTGNTGNVRAWLASTDGINWNPISENGTSILVKNVLSTTYYKALVQNGQACNVDSSSSATITINYKSVAGQIIPANLDICLDQNVDNILKLRGSSGTVLNWQKSLDRTNWLNQLPFNNDTLQSVIGLSGRTYFRAIVSKTGCPTDTSTISSVAIFNTPFPKAQVYPKDTIVCYGTAVSILANIQIGTSYSWSNPTAIFNGGNGIVNGRPFFINAKAAPSKKTAYMLSIANAGCPNLLYDTIRVSVTKPLTVNAGKDTSVAANQPVQLNANLSDERIASYQWSPSDGLDKTNIPIPIAINGSDRDNIRYTVTAVDSMGCRAVDNLLITIFKNGADIFVPTGFTPNADGKNDQLRPLAVGITKNYYFSVYNRWGQQVFLTTEIGKGWDGIFQGKAQASGAYVFLAEGIDYLGQKIIKKGTVVLIR
jgi:gliding motility-associated-like protein